MLIYQWSPIAMVRITAWLAAGIVFGIPQWLPRDAALIGFILLAIFFYAAVIHKQKIATGIIGLASVFMAGLQLGSHWDASQESGHLTGHPDSFQYYLARVAGPPEQTRSGNRIPVRITATHDHHGWKLLQSGSHLLTGTDPPEVIHGEYLLVKGMPQQVQSTGNPNEFDYRTHLARQGIFFRHKVSAAEVVVVSGPVRNLRWLANTGRQACIKRINDLLPDPQAAGITLALLIGITDGIDPELITSYAATGTLHVLAVSGMHVGVIYWLVMTLLAPLQRLHNGDRYLAALAILLLWVYAMITGLSPSVLRATIMCSFMALSTPFRLNTRLDNTLAASAFLLMLDDPLVITRAGFQLSFLAVAGILLINQKLHSRLEPSFKPAAWAWSITAVSVSAQYLTLPLTLYLFNQFPVWFIPANLVIIPLSFAVMGFGMALLIAGKIAVIGPWLITATEWTVQIMNDAASLIEHLPMAVIRDIRISGMQAVLLFMMLISILILVKVRRLHWIFIGLAFAALFALSDVFTISNSSAVTGFTVYRQPGRASIDLRNGTQVIHLGQPDDPHSKKNNLVNATSVIRSIDSGTIPMAQFRIGQDTLIYLNALPPDRMVLHCRWLIVGRGAKGYQFNNLKVQHVIVATDVSSFEAKRVETRCKSRNIPVHLTARSGAFRHEQPGLPRLD
ncbi:MAG: ComEC/Rec2 family competence protein [Bacteroidota bacterium]